MPIIATRASAAYGAGFSRVVTAAYAGPFGAYDALASITVAAGGTSSVTFDGIPDGYEHLQLRYSATTNRTTYAHDGVLVTFNRDTAARYSYHILRGRGVGTPDSSGGPNEPNMYFDWGFGTTVTNYPTVAIFDITDYASRDKRKTLRGTYGLDTNGLVAGYRGVITSASGAYYSPNSVSSITLTSANGFNIAENSTFALYGVK